MILSGQITRRQLRRKGEDEEKQRVQLRDTAMRAERVLFCRDWPSSVLSSHISMLSRIILGERREGVQPEPKKAISRPIVPFPGQGVSRGGESPGRPILTSSKHRRGEEESQKSEKDPYLREIKDRLLVTLKKRGKK